jgi:hypothetical protein
MSIMSLLLEPRIKLLDLIKYTKMNLENNLLKNLLISLDINPNDSFIFKFYNGKC